MTDKVSWVRVFNPAFKHPTNTLKDYVEVPRLAVRGVWQVKDMLPDETIVQMAILANALEKGQKRPS